MNLINKYIILTKIKDNVEPTPDSLPIGSKAIQGYYKYSKFAKGCGLHLYPTPDLTAGPQTITSDIVEFDEENMILVTVNSTYKVEIND